MLLYLLSQDPASGRGSVEIAGRHWNLAPQDLNHLKIEETPFICLSYTWGNGRERSPFHAACNISDRTVPALKAIVRHRPSCKHFWIDAFCVPINTPERAHTLESMGFIYSQAEEVIVVLSSAARPVLEQMSTSDHVGSGHLDILEREEWITRSWTYQEAVNSKTLNITCEGTDSAILDGSRFLNCLGYTLSRQGSSGLVNDQRERYPRLDAFEDLIADYMTAGYQERSALQVMSNMDRRTQQHSEDHFYAMLGAISTTRASSSETLDPCEAFMSLCERKGDYSFIYSAAKRASTPSKRWRPMSGDLPSILPWHCWGDGQPAHEDEGSLYLDQMMLFKNSPTDEDGVKFVEAWLTSSRLGVAKSTESLQESAYAALQTMGFRGSPKCVATTHGFFFPSEPIAADEEIILLVATTIRWTFGAPGLARCGGIARSYIPGVFFGRIEKEAATSVKVS